MRLQVSCLDRIGLAREILAVLEQFDINTNAIDASAVGFVYLSIPTLSFEQLQQLMPRLRKITNVTDVRTVPYMPSEREHHTMKALLKALPDPILSVDLKGQITTVNAAALTLLNRKATELLLQPIHRIIPELAFEYGQTPMNAGQTAPMSIDGSHYLAEIVPIELPNEEGASIVAGAIIQLKSAVRLGKQFEALRQAHEGFDALLAVSETMQQQLEQARRFALLDAPLLLLGESGTGKTQLAKACHHASSAIETPLVAFFCRDYEALSVEKALFGSATEAGALQRAQGGTLLLHDIDALPKSAQSRLVAALQSGEFTANEQEPPLPVQCRLISTSQQSLSELCQHVRDDLLYRLSALTLTLPTLRERVADIMPLADLFLSHFREQFNKPQLQFTASCRDQIRRYSWPGNVRQLKNTLYQAAAAPATIRELTFEELAIPAEPAPAMMFDDEQLVSLEQTVKEFEADILRKLYPTYPSTRQLARKLGMSHTAIANKLREYGIGKQR